MPKSNRAFWRKKLLGNIARDKKVNRHLRQSGWRVLRIWEHALRHPAPLATRFHRVLARPQPRTKHQEPETFFLF
jgi:DNA mismatch endonuclease (patch repair protein)